MHKNYPLMTGNCKCIFKLAQLCLLTHYESQFHNAVIYNFLTHKPKMDGNAE